MPDSMALLGLDQNVVNAATLAQARPLVAQWIKLVRVFDSDSPKTPLLNGDVDLGVVWSGEAARLIEENKKFTFVLPVEGYHPFVDVLAIPTTAKNVAAAHRFIDYVLRPEVSKLISDAFPYTNPNLAARKLLSPAQLANPASYPPVEKLNEEVQNDFGLAPLRMRELFELIGGLMKVGPHSAATLWCC